MAYYGDTTRPNWIARKLNVARFMVDAPCTVRDYLRNYFFLSLQFLIAYIMIFLVFFIVSSVRWTGYKVPRPPYWDNVLGETFLIANILIFGVLIIFSPLIYQSCRWWYCKIRGIAYIPPKDRSKNKWIILRSFDPRADASSEAKSNENIHQALDK